MNLTVACAMMPAVTLAQMQIPGVGSMVPDKAQFLEQAQKLLADLTYEEQRKLGAADTAKVDSLLPKATAVNTELAKSDAPAICSTARSMLVDSSLRRSFIARAPSALAGRWWRVSSSVPRIRAE